MIIVFSAFAWYIHVESTDTSFGQSLRVLHYIFLIFFRNCFTPKFILICYEFQPMWPNKGQQTF